MKRSARDAAMAEEALEDGLLLSEAGASMMDLTGITQDLSSLLTQLSDGSKDEDKVVACLSIESLADACLGDEAPEVAAKVFNEPLLRRLRTLYLQKMDQQAFYVAHHLFQALACMLMNMTFEGDKKRMAADIILEVFQASLPLMEGLKEVCQKQADKPSDEKHKTKAHYMLRLGTSLLARLPDLLKAVRDASEEASPVILEVREWQACWRRAIQATLQLYGPTVESHFPHDEQAEQSNEAAPKTDASVATEKTLFIATFFQTMLQCAAMDGGALCQLWSQMSASRAEHPISLSPIFSIPISLMNVMMSLESESIEDVQAPLQQLLASLARLMDSPPMDALTRSTHLICYLADMLRTLSIAQDAPDAEATDDEDAWEDQDSFEDQDENGENTDQDELMDVTEQQLKSLSMTDDRMEKESQAPSSTPGAKLKARLATESPAADLFCAFLGQLLTAPLSGIHVSIVSLKMQGLETLIPLAPASAPLVANMEAFLTESRAILLAQLAQGKASRRPQLLLLWQSYYELLASLANVTPSLPLCLSAFLIQPIQAAHAHGLAPLWTHDAVLCAYQHHMRHLSSRIAAAAPASSEHTLLIDALLQDFTSIMQQLLQSGPLASRSLTSWCHLLFDTLGGPALERSLVQGQLNLSPLLERLGALQAAFASGMAEYKAYLKALKRQKSKRATLPSTETVPTPSFIASEESEAAFQGTFPLGLMPPPGSLALEDLDQEHYEDLQVLLINLNRFVQYLRSPQ